MLQGILSEDSSSFSSKSFVYCFVASLSSESTKISHSFLSHKTDRNSAILAALGMQAFLKIIFKDYTVEIRNKMLDLQPQSTHRFLHV